MKQEPVAEAIKVEPVEDINTIKGELEKLKTELEQTKKGLSTAHQTLTQKDRELKAQSDFSNKLSSIEQRLEEQRQISELQAAAIAMGRDGSEEELAKVNQQLHARVAEQENNRKQAEIKRQQEIMTQSNREYNEQADAVFAQAQTLFEGEELKDIEDLLKSGNLILAQREVRIASKSKTPIPKTPHETEEAKVARVVKETLMREHPDLYKSDVSEPSGTGGAIPTDKEQFGVWLGKLSDKEFEKNRALINEMRREGKIK